MASSRLTGVVVVVVLLSLSSADDTDETLSLDMPLRCISVQVQLFLCLEVEEAAVVVVNQATLQAKLILSFTVLVDATPWVNKTLNEAKRVCWSVTKEVRN